MTDYAAVEAKNRELGKAGEKLILEYEKALLTQAGRDDLLVNVRHTAEDDGDGTGYDIESVTPEGEIKYIEVKTTRGPARTPFIITANEVEFSEEHPDNYYLYRVYKYDSDRDSGGFYVVRGRVKDSFGLESTQFRATR